MKPEEMKCLQTPYDLSTSRMTDWLIAGWQVALCVAVLPTLLVFFVMLVGVPLFIGWLMWSMLLDAVQYAFNH